MPTTAIDVAFRPGPGRGVIVPMFNDYIDATGDKVGGWVDDPNGELMGGHALTKCWLNA